MDNFKQLEIVKKIAQDFFSQGGTLYYVGRICKR